MTHGNAIVLATTLAAFTGAIDAGPRESPSYAVPTGTADAGGGRATSASYTNDGSAGGVSGLSTVTAPAGTVKAGYIGQLYEVKKLETSAASPRVDEGSTVQLTAAQLLDDDSTLSVDPISVAWSVLSGPLASIDAAGLATADLVYQDTPATAQGGYAGAAGITEVTVSDSLADNFGSYAGDGLDDDWQVRFFGLDNPDAAPLLDPDRDGQNNRFEFLAGLVPVDPRSRFSLAIAPVEGQSTQKNLVFHPLVDGRTYTVKFGFDPGVGSWTTLDGGIVTDRGDERTVTDAAATENTKFYTVEITKP